MSKKRRRFKQTTTLQDRLSDFACELREEARAYPPGPEREELLKRARGADTAALWDEWLRSPGQTPPIL
nr:hypothetical protein [Bradyrhizobium sp. BRP20]